MKPVRRVHGALQLTASSAMVLVLAACGGGSGSDGGLWNGGGGDGPALTSENAAQVASATYRIGDLLYATAGNTAGILDLKSPDARSAQARPALAELALRRLLALEAAPAGGSRFSAKAVHVFDEPCHYGGSFVETWNDADNSGELSTGDSGSVTFSNCEEEPGLLLNGSMAITNIVIAGTAAQQSVGATFAFNNLAMIVDEGTVTAHGDMSIQATVTQSPQLAYDMTVHGKSLGMSSGDLQTGLASYNATVNVNYTHNTYAYAVGGTVSGTGMPTITMATPTPFAGEIGAFPSTGVSTAMAADGTAARLTVNSDTTVTVELDANGDAVFESSEQMTWEELADL